MTNTIAHSTPKRPFRPEAARAASEDDDRFAGYIDSVIECGIERVRDQLHRMFKAAIKIQYLTSDLDESLRLLQVVQDAFADGSRGLLGLEHDLRSEALREFAREAAPETLDAAAEE